MAEKSYAHRDILDKLGVREGMRVRLEGSIPDDLRKRLSEADDVQLVEESDGEPVNLVLASLDDGSATRPALAAFRKAILPHGAIWVLTPKKGRPGYLKQEALIPLGKAAGLIDNKVCSIDETTSAIRFVVPLAQREKSGPRPEGR
jgi:hypothetical protein